jgi:glycosyltransferase involved in cell wall biosynthesis
MSQNLLPFEWAEARRYGVSWWILKFLILRSSQLSTFKRANGIIFLSDYARTMISRLFKGAHPRTIIIPHGVDNRFRQEPRPQKELSNFSWETPFRLLYVSPIAPYKHHSEVMEAVWRLRKAGLPVSLELVGPIRNRGREFYNSMAHYDPKKEWIKYSGEISYKELHTIYHRSDAFVFASSCETISNILLEAMAAGLPIASSNRGPMPEVLGEAGIYFDPENPENISESIQMLLKDPILRERKAFAAYERAKTYTWDNCTQATFDFINRIVTAQA